MAQQVVTELVIDSSGATDGANVFSQAMAGAEQAANSGVASVTGFNVGLLALGTGATAALVGLKGMLDYVASANKDLADMGTVAHQVGLTLTDFQGIKFGGAIAGLSTDQINSGLEKSASLLNDASRNSNSLSKELDANGISVKNANGQLISENQLLGIAASLISNAKNPGDQLAIAQMLGFTKEWIPLLEQGSGAMSGLAAEAKAAGAVIDDETIQKATDFDTEWRKSSVEFSTYMKASLSELLPYVDQLIEGAENFIKSIDKAKIQKASDDSFKEFNDQTGIPESGVIHVDSDNLSQGLKDFQNSPVFSIDTWAALGRAFSDNIHFMSTDQAAATIPGYAASQYPVSDDPMNSAAYTKSGPQDFAALQKQTDWADDAAGWGSDGRSKVASKDVAGDAVDKAINSLNKHTQATLADAQAVGLGDAALAGFKADAAETAAVMANGGKETDAQVDKFSDLKDAAIAAADALSKAKVASSISFGQQTSFLSADDVAIATQLKGIYGNDVPKALASTEAASIRVNTAFKGVSSAIDTNLTSGLTDIVSGTKSASQGFTDMSNAIIKAIEQMIIKITIVEPMMRALQQAAGGLGVGNIFGSGAVSGASGSTGLSLTSTGGLYHTGGIVGSEPTSMRYIHPAHFNDAPRFHTGGIAGDEVPIIAKRGEGVFTQGQMAALGGGGSSSPNIIINNHTDAQPQVSTNSNGDVTVTLKKAIDSAVGDSLSSGTGMRVLNKQYGVKQFAGQ